MPQDPYAAIAQPTTNSALPPTMQTGSDPYASIAKAPDAPGMLDREIPLDSYTHATESGLQSIGRGVRDAVKGTVQMLDPRAKDAEEEGVVASSPQGRAALPVYRILRSLGHTAEDATHIAGAIHDINQSPDPLGTYAKVAQETAGQGAGQAAVALATEGVAKAAPLLGDAAGAAASGVKPALAKVGSAATAVGESLDPDVVGLVSPRAAHALRLANKVGKVASKFGTEAAPEIEPVYPGASQPEHPGTFPGAPEPTGAPEQINPSLVSPSRSLPGQIGPEQIYSPRPTPAQPIPARPGLQLTGEVAAQAVPAAAVAPTPAAAATPTSSTAATLEAQLNEALGGKKLVPGVSLKNQAAAAVKLPDGFTPVDSSALKGYKYDPATREFQSITQGGQHYIHGDVSPEEAQTFADADSKGKAWQQIRGSNPLVAKVVNGQRVSMVKARSVVVDPESGKPEFSDVLDAKQNAAQATPTPAPKTKTAAASTGSSEEDLTSLLQQSLDQVKAEKGGVRTTAAPADLAKRWGVDETSIADTDANVRGLNAQQSQAYVNKLAAAYKQGRPPEPVIETRDASNNITSVDGRHRALAAKKAGIERIPVIVRRISVQ